MGGFDSSLPPVAFAQIAMDKLTRVLGAAQAQRVFEETLIAARIRGIDSADELYIFGEQLAKRGGFEAAVGRLLGIAAVLRGASARP